MTSVVFACFLALSVFGVESVAVFAKADDAAVVVGAVGSQQMMRNVNHMAADPKPDAAATNSTAEKPDEKASIKDKAEAVKPAVVTINLYYETKCPDCVDFINTTLAPLWRNKDLSAHYNITMNPYGNAMSIPAANVSKGYKFWHPESTGHGWEYVHICQHGTDECLGNLIQACAISISKQEQYMELILCMADKPNWSIEKASFECMQKHGIDHDTVKECVNSPQGNKLFADFGKTTGAVNGRQGTPWVLINGINLVNTTDLMGTVCNHVGEGGPSSCTPFLTKATPAAKPEDKPEAGGDDGDFTVLPVLKKERALAKLSADQI